MRIKYQIFVSSTFLDLEEERRTVIEQILNLGHIPVGMELFQAGDQSQWTYIKDRILECDYYIVIVGERYGCEGPEGKSYTQMEYEFAVANEVPVAAFLLHEEARKTWPRDRVEFDKADKLNAFRSLSGTRMAKHWRNADDLGARVVTTLTEMTRTTPRVGWVRANSVASEAALNEIAKLSEERRHLQAQVEQLKANDGELRVPPDIRHRLDEMLNLDVQTLVVTNAHPLIKPQSLLKLFVAVYKRFAQPCNVGTAKMVINEVLGVSYPQVGVDLIIDELCAQNIIEFIRLPGANGGSFKHYKLTDYGKECAMFAKLLVSSPSREDA